MTDNKCKECVRMTVSQDEYISILEEQYEELKKDKEYLDKVNNEQTEVILKLNEQIEKMKNCRNCEHDFDWEDNDYCVGCLSLFHDKKPKWEMRK